MVVTRKGDQRLPGGIDLAKLEYWRPKYAVQTLVIPVADDLNALIHQAQFAEDRFRRMRIFLDTHDVVAGIGAKVAPPVGNGWDQFLAREDTIFLSVASLWDIAIKHRPGKLALAAPLHETPAILRSIGARPLSIDNAHVLADITPQPPPRDPFDRLLLAPCARGELRLATQDEALGRPPAGDCLKP